MVNHHGDPGSIRHGVAWGIVIGGALLLVPVTAPGYRRSEVDGVPGRYLFWPQRRLSYVVNERGCGTVSKSETLGAVERSFSAWASPPCTDIAFVFEGLVASESTNLASPEGDDLDGQNLVVWREAWPPPDADPVSRYVPAITTTIYEVETGQILDADIDLNAQDFIWSATDDPQQVATDIQNILAHEVGHLLGLTHSQERAATMFAYTDQGEIDKRTLHADDELGVCSIYPDGEPTPEGLGQGRVPGHGSGCQMGPPEREDRSLVLGLLFLLFACLAIKAGASYTASP